MMPENEQTREYETTVIAPHGLGFGEGSISVAVQLNERTLHEDSLREAQHIVLHDPEVFTPVDTDAKDDGCGDGRSTSLVYRLLDPISRRIETFNKSRRRAKLFGGGLVASASMWRAAHGIPAEDATLVDDRKTMARVLAARGVRHGAHSDTHAKGELCGCGAIDKYELISRNVTVYREQILSTLPVLYGEAFDDNLDAITSVLDMYGALGDDYFAGVTGRGTLNFIEKEGAVVKQLDGEHMEDMVVLNDVEGTTLDQDTLRRKLSDKGLSTDIQSFVVDVWRGRMVGSSRVDLQACKLEYSIVSPK